MSRKEMIPRQYRDDMRVPIKGYYVEFKGPTGMAVLLHGQDNNPTLRGLMYGTRAVAILQRRNHDGYSIAPTPFRTREMAVEIAGEELERKFYSSGKPIPQFVEGTTWKLYNIEKKAYEEC